MIQIYARIMYNSKVVISEVSFKVLITQREVVTITLNYVCVTYRINVRASHSHVCYHVKRGKHLVSWRTLSLMPANTRKQQTLILHNVISG